jgi:hypothetical protein
MNHWIFVLPPVAVLIGNGGGAGKLERKEAGK